MKYLINSQPSLEEITGRIKREFQKKKYIWVNITSGKRSLDSNALSFHWYREISEQGDMQPNDVRNYCKYHYGLPILAAAEPGLSGTLRKALQAIEYEDRLEMMGKF
ncbi:MAG: hypothetical protein GY928_22290, partial [Colwellia sp.]|nr:hypothetical protein [Colwellia sp.]